MVSAGRLRGESAALDWNGVLISVLHGDVDYRLGIALFPGDGENLCGHHLRTHGVAIRVENAFQENYISGIKAPGREPAVSVYRKAPAADDAALAQKASNASLVHPGVRNTVKRHPSPVARNFGRSRMSPSTSSKAKPSASSDATAPARSPCSKS